jgi:CHAD domain-containing protein
MGDKPALRPGAPVGVALVAIAHDILAEGRAALADIERGETAVGVHDYRKAMKRWRAYLRLVEAFLPPQELWLRIRARDLARQLASARDSQAALDALSDIEKAELGLSPTSLKTMRSRIAPAKEAAEASALTPELREQLSVALASAGYAVDAWALQDVAFQDVAAELARYYRRARQAFPAAWTQAGAEELHNLRRCVVVHRYQMELVELLWPRLGKLWVGEAQRLRDRLGWHQDLVVLAGLTAPHRPLAPWRSRLAPLIEQRKTAHAAAAQRLAGRLFAEKPKAFRRRLAALWESRGEESALTE